MEAIDVKADSEFRCVDELWVCWVRWVFYWSVFVFNGVVFVWYFGSRVSCNWESPGTSSISNLWNDVFTFMFSYFSLDVSEINWGSFSLLSSQKGRYNVGSGNIFVSKGTVNLDN